MLVMLKIFLAVDHFSLSWHFGVAPQCALENSVGKNSRSGRPTMKNCVISIRAMSPLPKSRVQLCGGSLFPINGLIKRLVSLDVSP
jgi:hypothetical protein